MAKQIEGVSEKIEKCAREEFLKNGYTDASLRTIASEAGTTTGSIYSRYGDKEGLFSAIVEPAANEFIEKFRSIQEEFHSMESDRQAESLEDFTMDGMQRMVEYMYEHLEEFRLLVNAAHGTKFQNFVEHLVEIETDYTYKFMESVGLDPTKRKHITKDFMHIMNKALFESFFEVIRHDMSKEEAPSQNEPDTITLKDYVFAYDVKTILDIRNLQIPRNEVIAITGQNGAGKSTFIRCLCGLQKKFKGRTVINSKEYKPKEMLKLCYLVMQDVNHQLFCETVEDEIVLGSGDTDDLRAKELMEKLGLSEFKDRHPMSLSGGQKQRVAIASSMLAGKEILIFDEPTSGLDYRHMIQTAELFIRLKESGKSVLIITHDRELIRKCCTFEIHIAQGKAEVNKYESN